MWDYSYNYVDHLIALRMCTHLAIRLFANCCTLGLRWAICSRTAPVPIACHPRVTQCFWEERNKLPNARIMWAKREVLLKSHTTERVSRALSARVVFMKNIRKICRYCIRKQYALAKQGNFVFLPRTLRYDTRRKDSKNKRRSCDEGV